MSEDLKTAFDAGKTAEDKKGKEPSYPFFAYESESELERLENVFSELKKTKTGRQLIADAEAHQTTVKLESGMRAYGSYDEVKNIVKLNPTSDHNRLVGTAAHELRHAQQFKNGILLDAYLDMPKCYIQNQAVIEADACATATQVCYDLAVQGNPAPLESLREKDAHIVNPFQNAAVQGGLADGSAHRAAFYGWFTSYSTRDCYDINYCKMFRQRFKNATREEEKIKLERDVPVTETVEKVCSMADGKSYLDKKEAEVFFNTQDAGTISFERFNNVYSELYFKYNLDYKLGTDKAMEQFGLYPRPHSSYMPSPVVPEPLPIPTKESRQAEAAQKIASLKEDKKDMSPVVFNAALQKKMRVEK